MAERKKLWWRKNERLTHHDHSRRGRGNDVLSSIEVGGRYHGFIEDRDAVVLGVEARDGSHVADGLLRDRAGFRVRLLLPRRSRVDLLHADVARNPDDWHQAHHHEGELPGVGEADDDTHHELRPALDDLSQLVADRLAIDDRRLRDRRGKLSRFVRVEEGHVLGQHALKVGRPELYRRAIAHVGETNHLKRTHHEGDDAHDDEVRKGLEGDARGGVHLVRRPTEENGEGAHHGASRQRRDYPDCEYDDIEWGGESIHLHQRHRLDVVVLVVLLRRRSMVGEGGVGRRTGGVEHAPGLRGIGTVSLPRWLRREGDARALLERGRRRRSAHGSGGG